MLEDNRTGVIAAQIWNTQRTKESDKFWSPGDFFPSLKDEKAEERKYIQPSQSVDEQVAAMEAWTALAGSHFKHGRGRKLVEKQ